MNSNSGGFGKSGVQGLPSRARTYGPAPTGGYYRIKIILRVFTDVCQWHTAYSPLGDSAQGVDIRNMYLLETQDGENLLDLSCTFTKWWTNCGVNYAKLLGGGTSQFDGLYNEPRTSDIVITLCASRPVTPRFLIWSSVNRDHGAEVWGCPVAMPPGPCPEDYTDKERWYPIMNLDSVEITRTCFPVHSRKYAGRMQLEAPDAPGYRYRRNKRRPHKYWAFCPWGSRDRFENKANYAQSSSSDGTYACVSEVEFLDGPGGTDLATGGTTYASSDAVCDQGSSGSHAELFDGDTTTGVLMFDQGVVYEFPNPVAPTHIGIWSGGAAAGEAGDLYAFDVWFSDDRKLWYCAAQYYPVPAGTWDCYPNWEKREFAI